MKNKCKIVSVLCCLACAILFVSCAKDEVVDSKVREEGVLNISIATSTTKASGSAHGNQSADNVVNTLELFLFNSDGPNVGELDAYKKFTTADGLTNLQIKGTVGNKNLFVVANSHRADWNGVVKVEKFKEQIALLQKDNVSDFTMIASKDVDLKATSSVTISIERLVARVAINSIKTDFTGTPYSGMKLSNVKLYLVNVNGDKYFWDGSAPTNPVVLNNKLLNAVDANGCSMTGMIYDEILPLIDDSGYTTPHYLYAYENILDTETPDRKFTRLVIQADLNGKTYYYPININQNGFGHLSSLDHFGIKRNRAYSYDVVIKRPGSTDPDKVVEHGVLSASLSVVDWTVIAAVSTEF